MLRMPRSTRLAPLALLPLLAACAGAPVPTPPVDATPGAALEIPLDPYLGKLRTVEVEVGGRSLPFLFDTAGGVTLVTPEVAAEAGCEPFGHDVGFRHNGEPVTFERCRGLTLALAGRSTRDDEVAVWDLMTLLQGAPVVGGIVALTSFEGETVTLDLARGRLQVEPRPGPPPRLAGAKALQVRASRQGGGSSLDLFVAVDSPKGPLWFELDSGALSPVLVAPHAADLLGLDLSPDEPRQVTLPIHGLGPVQIDAQVQPDLIYDGLLNAAFLERIIITMDLDSIQAWATLHPE